MFAVIDPVVNKAQVALYPILENGNWGLMDESGTTVVPAIYSSAFTVGDNLIEIGLPAGKGLIDRQGNEILPVRYAEIHVQNDSMVWFREGNGWGYLHLPSGNSLPPIYDRPAGFFVNKTVLEIKEQADPDLGENSHQTWYTCISYDARILIPPTKYKIDQCHDTRDLVRLESENGYYGFWNVSTGEHFEPIYREMKQLAGQRFAAKRERDAAWQLISPEGKLLSELEFNWLRNRNYGWLEFQSLETRGLINSENEVLMLGDWEQTLLIGSHNLAFKENGLWGILNVDGSVVFPPSFDVLSHLGDDLIEVSVNSLHGMIEGVVSASGDTILPIDRRPIRALSGGPGFAVFEGSGWTWYNNYGLASEAKNFDQIDDFQNGLALISRDKKVGLMDTQGVVVVPVEYDQITIKPDRVYAMKGENQKLFSFDEEGRLLTGNRFILVRGNETDRPAGGRNQQFDQLGWFLYPGTGKYGLRIPDTDSVIISPRYDRVMSIGNTGLTLTEITRGDETRYGLVDYGRMRRAIEPVLRELQWGDFYQGNVARVTLQNGRRTYMSRTGKIMYSDRLRYVGRFSEGKARVMVDGKIKWERRSGSDALEVRTFREDGRLVTECLFAYEGKWAIINGNGKWISRPEYDYVSDFENGIALVKKGDKWGVLDSNMETIVGIEWEYLTRLGSEPGDPLIAGKSNGTTGYVSVDGNTITGANNDGLGFENGRDFSEGLVAVQRDGKWGVIDQNGRIQIQMEFDAVGDFHEGVAWVRKGRKVMLANRQGILTETEKDVYRMGDFHEGLAWAQSISNGRYGYLDPTGNWVIAPQYLEAEDFCHGLAIVRESSGRGMINMQGKEVVKARYQKIFPFENGMAIVRHNRKYGCIDSLGEVVVKPHFLKIEPFREGLAQVKTGSWRGFINKQGEVVIKGNYRQLADFSEGMAAARVKDRWGYLNKQGQMVIEPQYIIARDFGGGLAAAYERGHWHLIDTAGQDLVPPKSNLSSVGPFQDGMAVARSKEEWRYMDSLGNYYSSLRGEPLEGLAPFSQGIGQVKVRGGWKLVDRAMQPLMTINFKNPFSFTEDMGRVQFGMKYAMIAPDGTVLLEPRYDLMRRMGPVIQVGEGADLGYVRPDGSWVRK